MEFRTELTTANVQIYGQQNDTDLQGSVTVDWVVDIEARSWGVKGISAYVVSFDADIWDENNPSDGDRQADENAELPDVNSFEIISEIEPDEFSAFMVVDCVIDLSDKTITFRS